ncbi:MAG: YdiU family protein [Vulcanimicrobiota bacterium]
MNLRFDNRFLEELPGDPREGGYPRQVLGACWSRVKPTSVRAPRLLAYAREVGDLLGLTAQEIESERFAQVFAGNDLEPGMDPYAACYGGHQFGNWAGQLGDGRAINLGEVVHDDRRWEIQLKGSGLTPYSRHADGRAVLRSSLREFLCSEAMHHLGVPTTRALSLVLTGDQVIRDMFYDGNPEPEPGAVVCRVAPSFLRFGNYEILAARDNTELLTKLVDFTIDRDFPELEGDRAAWFGEVCRRTAVMVAHWMRVGFVHGVMNTDNMSILGLTIDYGPYGWLDNFDPDWTPNTTDAARRRYRYGHQPAVAQWNLVRLASALVGLFEDDTPLQQGLNDYVEVFNRTSQEFNLAKFGLGQADDLELVEEAYGLMARAEVDMTLFFRALPGAASVEDLAHAFYDEDKRQTHRDEFSAWLERYLGRALPERRATMDAVNPLYVPRNYLAQEAIDEVETSGETTRLEALLEAFRRPYTEQPGCQHFAEKRPDWARNRPGCSMLSCSS